VNSELLLAIQAPHGSTLDLKRIRNDNPASSSFQSSEEAELIDYLSQKYLLTINSESAVQERNHDKAYLHNQDEDDELIKVYKIETKPVTEQQ